MAKFQSLSLLLAISFFLSSLCIAHGFVVEGKVYCDTCRAGFETSLTYYIPGVEVKLECTNMTSHQPTFSTMGVTDGTGTYQLNVPGDHEEEICQVMLVSSPASGCNEPPKSGRDRAVVVLTKKNGIISDVRYANPLGYLKAEVLPLCAKMMELFNML